MRGRTILTTVALLLASAAFLAAGANAVVPGANGPIFYGSNASGSYNIWRVAADGTGATQLTTQPDNSVGAQRPSTDGDGGKVAFAEFDDTGGQFNSEQIWVMNGDGTGQTQLTHSGNNFINTDPAISPDGSKIAWIGADVSGSGTTGFDLYEMNTDGTNPTQLTNTTQDDKNPEFSPDGSKIVFVRATGSNQIWLMNADGSNPHVLLDNPGVQDVSPSWSPDGTKIVYSDSTNGLSVMNADGSNPTPLHDASGHAIAGQDPAWSPDGTKIAFYYVPNGGGSEGIFTIPAGGGSDPQQLINLPTDFQSIDPSWAAVVSAPSPPDTKITRATISSKKGRARFKFAAVGDATGFQCALLKKSGAVATFKACTSPKRYSHLHSRHYTFEVRALNGGLADPTPAKKTFKIKR